MEIRFGAPLRVRGGAQTGAIRRVVLESETQRLRALTVRIGHVFAHERVIGANLLNPSEDDRRVVADLDVADIALLPLLSEAYTADSSGNRDRVQPYSSWTGGEVSVTTYIGGSAAVNRRVSPSFDVPEADRDITLVDARTTVKGQDGTKVGTVCAVVCDAAGTAIGLLVKRPGFFQRREVYVPTDLASFSGETSSILGLEWNE